MLKDFSPNQRIAIFAVGGLLAVGFFGVCLMFVYLLAAPSPAVPAPAPTIAPLQEAPPSEPAPPPTPTILEFEGSGDAVRSFSSTGFSAILVGAGQDTGTSNLQIWVKTSGGDIVPGGGAANCIGECYSENVVKLPGDGDYFFDVSAGGDWWIIVQMLE